MFIYYTKKNNISKNETNLSSISKHGYHIIDPSPWPFFASLSACMFTIGMVMFMHGYVSGKTLLQFGFLFLLFVSYCWWSDVVREATLEGQHTSFVQIGLRMGMLLFIVSEIMFFFAFFFAFFYSTFNPNLGIGGVWPPAFITTIDPWQIPLLNTLILLSSGAAVTWAHQSIVVGSKFNACVSLLVTVALATVFTGLQVFEYGAAPFTIADGIYGSTFYMTTGLHGVHVFIGTCFLTVCLIRLFYNHFTREHHFGFEAAAWYWHFVDVVWLFLFITIYWWGS